jgi:hypothetical protein
MSIFFYFFITAFVIIQSCQEKLPHPGEAIYQTYCTGCHGNQMQRSLAAPLIKTDWIYGRDKGNIMRNVRYGINGTQMAEWSKFLTREQMTDVVKSLWLRRARQWGCRFLFDKEGSLYFSIGDMSRDSLSQDVTHPAGNVCRINPDGSIYVLLNQPDWVIRLTPEGNL